MVLTSVWQQDQVGDAKENVPDIPAAKKSAKPQAPSEKAEKKKPAVVAKARKEEKKKPAVKEASKPARAVKKKPARDEVTGLKTAEVPCCAGLLRTSEGE